jgi:hypothetical protein
MLPKETEDRRTAVAQMKRVEIITDSLYDRMLRCDMRGIETDIIEMSQMHAGLAKLGYNLTHDEKQTVLKSYDKYKSSIDMLEKKCICNPIVMNR